MKGRALGATICLLSFSSTAAVGQTFEPITGDFETLVVVLEYPDAGLVTTPSKAENWAGRFKEDLEEYSYGKPNVVFDVHDHVILMPCAWGSYSGPRLYADIADHMDTFHSVDIDAYDRLWIFSKWGQQGPVTVPLGPRMVVSDPGTGGAISVRGLIHEWGHSNMWWHADSWLVKSTQQQVPDNPNGCKVVYYDYYDHMGFLRFLEDPITGGLPPPDECNLHSLGVWKWEGGHFGPWLKLRADWLEDGDIFEPSGIYSPICADPDPEDIIRIASLDQNPKSAGGADYSAIRFPIETDKDLWIYYRGYETEEVDGVSLQWASRGRHWEDTYLLDMGVSTPNDLTDSYLKETNTFTDHTGTYSLTVVDVDENHTWADVCIEAVNGLPDPDQRPVIDVTNPGFAEVHRGTIDFFATAYDPDVGMNNGDGITNVNFQLYSPAAAESISLCGQNLLAATSFTAPSKAHCGATLGSECGSEGSACVAYRTVHTPSGGAYKWEDFDTEEEDDGTYYLLVWATQGPEGPSLVPTAAAFFPLLFQNLAPGQCASP